MRKKVEKLLEERWQLVRKLSNEYFNADDEDDETGELGWKLSVAYHNLFWTGVTLEEACEDAPGNAVRIKTWHSLWAMDEANYWESREALDPWSRISGAAEELSESGCSFVEVVEYVMKQKQLEKFSDATDEQWAEYLDVVASVMCAGDKD